jgi:hypothetical protein
VLSDLVSQPWLAGEAEVVEAIGEISAMIERGQAESVARYGFDPLTQLTSAALCMRIDVEPDSVPTPQFLAVVQGAVPQSAIAPIGGEIEMTPTVLPTGQSAFTSAERGFDVMLFSPMEGVLVLGSGAYYPALVGGMPAMELGPPTEAGSLMTRLPTIARGGARAFLALRPDTETASLLDRELTTSLTQLVRGMQSAVLDLGDDALYLEGTATDADTHARFGMITRGTGALAEAAPSVLFGTLNMIFGALSPDDPEIEPEGRRLLAQRESIMASLSAWGLTTPLGVTVQEDPAAMRSTLLVSGDGVTTGLGGLTAMTMLIALLRDHSHASVVAPMPPSNTVEGPPAPY